MWSKLVWWVIWRGFVGGAIFGALLGALFGFIYGAAIGLFVGGLAGSTMGFVDGILLAGITKFAYAPPNSTGYYPKTVYTVAILTNTAPIFIIFGGLNLSCVVVPFSLVQSLIYLIFIGGIPALVIGIITAYFAGGFLEYADSQISNLPSRNPPVNVLS